jgi:hypothetical protein
LKKKAFVGKNDLKLKGILGFKVEGNSAVINTIYE